MAPNRSIVNAQVYLEAVSPLKAQRCKPTLIRLKGKKLGAWIGRNDPGSHLAPKGLHRLKVKQGEPAARDFMQRN
jgi:hypothetical protein